jgi:excisionase family DNA binding protein
MRNCVNGRSQGGEGVIVLADAPDFLTLEEAAQILRIGRNQAYELARVWRATGGERGVPVVEFGRRYRVPKAALMRLAGLAEPLGADHAG